jgi:hypothetical protein
MRHDPIEIAMAGSSTRRRAAGRATKFSSAGSKGEPCVIDEAFARFDGIDDSTSRGRNGDRRMMKDSLVSDLAAQLEAIDRQRERLVRLLQSVETNSIAD